MSRSKIFAAGAALIVLIIIAGFSVLSIVQASTVGNVEKSQVEQTSDTGAKLSWDKVSAADGYYIYQSAAGENDFQSIGFTEGENTTEFEVTELEQATAYDFYITAYKDNKNKNVESEEHTVLSLCTLPTAQTLKSVASDDEGELDAEWEINPKAAGYHVQYVKGDGTDFEGAVEEYIEDKAVPTYHADGLEPKATYSVRVRSYIPYNDGWLYGAWSEVQSVEIAEKVAMAANIDPSKPMVALTFDDGPGYNGASDRILDCLEQYGARATFFMVGKNAKDHPDNLKRKVALGMEIGNHTWDHSHYGSAVTVSDIKDASDAIYNACGVYPNCFRSPGGNTTQTILDECVAESMVAYYWSLDTQDWKSRDANTVYYKVMDNVQDGDIILMHEIYDSTAQAVEWLVPELIKQGYQLVTCEELVYCKTGSMPETGHQYMNGTTMKDKTS
ncbi:MAG: polysaccharide deacetylase family protein [Eubacterium sp.]|nr:polysaccharide deacetylase family protein [Eubacterium sp.]